MSRPIVIVHGWSDKAKSFEHLAKFLRRELRTHVTTIDLADWVSLNDEITYKDLREAMQRAWLEHPELCRRRHVDVISHSTGALVVRDWMTHFYKPSTVPIRRHVMLAPANFGSQLAHKGRAWYGRVFKGWRTGFQTGGHLLRGLELASRHTWELAEEDLLGSQRWYGTDRIQACVFVGNHGYGGKAAVTDEVGGDGTVRVSTANLNVARLELFYDQATEAPRFKMKKVHSRAQIGFGVSEGDNHSSIAFKKKNKAREYAPFGEKMKGWLLKALTTPTRSWPVFVKALADSNQDVDTTSNDYYHGYQNTVMRVRDDLDNPVEEFLVEFRRGRSRTFKPENFGGRFQREILRHVHAHKSDSSYRSLYIDITALEDSLDGRPLDLSIEAQPEYQVKRAVGYEELADIRLDAARVKTFFEPHRTLLVDVRVPRKIGSKAFELERQGR